MSEVTFNPFSAEYEPRISNGAIESLADNINIMAANMNSLASQVKAEAEIQNNNISQLAANVAKTVEDFQDQARLILLAAKDELKNSVSEMVKEEIEKQVGNADSTE